MTRSRASLECGQTRSVCGASGLRHGVWRGCTISRGRQETHIRCAAAPARSAAIGVAAAARVGRVGCGTLAAALGVTDAAVWRVLRQEGIQLRRHRSWCVSTDPQFAAKAADIIGLYLEPPQRALVLSVDEKPSIQALDAHRLCLHLQRQDRPWPQEYLPAQRHAQLVRGPRRRHRSFRNKTTATKKRVDFQAFMDEVVADVPADRDVHVILDNYCTHKKNETWLAAHPNVSFHFTPTSASWLNQIEIWFGIFTRKALSGASFRSAEQLTQAIQDFTAAYNQRAAPFVWRKREVKGAQLRHTIVNLCN